MLIMKSGERETTEGTDLPNQERIRTLGKTKKFQVFGNIGNGHHQTSRNERKKIRKGYLKRAKKLLEKNASGNQTLLQKSHLKHLDSFPGKKLRIIHKMNKGRTQTSKPKNNEIDEYAQCFTFKR